MNEKSRAVLVVQPGDSDGERQAHPGCGRQRDGSPSEEYLMRRFPRIRLYRAFTDRGAVRSLRQKGKDADTVQEALERIRTDGYLQMSVQPAMITGGTPYEIMMEEIAARVGYGCFSAVIAGRPLLTEREDCVSFARILRETLSGSGECRPDIRLSRQSRDEEHGGRAVLLIGGRADERERALYRMLREELKAQGAEGLCPAAENEREDIEAFLFGLSERGVHGICLQPFTFLNDGGSSSVSEMRILLQKQGFDAEFCRRGLEDYEAVCRLFGDRLEQILPRED